MPLRPASSSARASRVAMRSSSGSPSVPIGVLAGSTSSLDPTFGPSITVARHTGCSARMRDSSSSNSDGIALPVERLDEQTDRAAARETDGERLVVAVAERDDPGLGLAVEDGQRLGDDGALDAAAADAAG